MFGNLLDPDSEIRYVLKNMNVFRLKEELQRRINVAIYPAKVDDILFNDLTIQ